jgi:glycosyltransferase involved in cell wall biosynthesis
MLRKYMPTISVIVPIYKVENYLPACLDSILAQTFQDFEAILVDDGSPDMCGSICDAYAGKDKRFRVIHQVNAGLSRARNTGIEASKGRYLCFVDGDDLIMPDYCQKLLSMLEDTECDYSACGVCRFTDGEIPDSEPDEEETVRISNAGYLRDQLSRKREFGVWNRLYRRELFETLRFYPGKIHEDVIFSADLACLRGGVVACRDRLYCYRQRKDGIVAEGSRRCSADWVFAGEYLIGASRRAFPELYQECLRYALGYPWTFVDRIYVERSFGRNRDFLQAFHSFLRKYGRDLKGLKEPVPVVQKRMELFAASPVLYGLNAYGRLLRVYLYRLMGKDAYADGHGI